MSGGADGLRVDIVQVARITTNNMLNGTNRSCVWCVENSGDLLYYQFSVAITIHELHIPSSSFDKDFRCFCCISQLID